MKIIFSYRQETIFSDKEEKFLSNKAKSFGKVVREPYSGIKGNAIGLLDCLQVIIVFTAGKYLSAYVGGLIGQDYFKNLGIMTRMKIFREIKAFKYFILNYYDCFIRNQYNNPQSHTFKIMIEDIALYAVINNEKMNDVLLEKLPNSIVNIYGKISLKHIIISNKTCQLYPDFDNNEWRYLFTPTNEGFGNYIDSYFDIIENRQYKIHSREDFIAKFNISESDKNKLIVYPYEQRLDHLMI